MRGADGGPWRRLCALPALWVGLLYDGGALDAAYDLVADWTAEEREAMRAEVPRLGLDARIRSRTLRDVALEVLDFAREGLHRRARRSSFGEDETYFLDTLFSIAGSGRTAASELLDDLATRWNGDIDRIYDEYSY
jgi:glutamate--cysteine ligase